MAKWQNAAQSAKSKAETPKFEGYWKENPNLSLVNFDVKDASEEQKKIGFAARNALNKTLVEMFKKDNDVIPEKVTKEADNREGYKKLDTDEAFRNKNTYPARATLTVAPAVYTNDFTGKDGVDHKKGDPIMKKDGTQALNIKAEWLIDTDALTLTLTEKGDITDVTARTGIAKGQKPTFVKKDDLAQSALSNDLKKLAGAIIDGGYIKTFEKSERQGGDLKNLAFELNQEFAELGKVTNKEGKEVQDVYAKYVEETYQTKDGKDGVRSCVQVFNHKESDVFVELGVTKSGDLYGKAVNLGLNENGQPRQEGQKALEVLLHNKEEVGLVPESFRNNIATVLGLDEPNAELVASINAQFKDNVIQQEDGTNKPLVSAVYHNGNDTVTIFNAINRCYVELGNTAEGKAYAIVGNPDEKDANNKTVKTFINKADDLNGVTLPDEVNDIIKNYKGFDNKEKSKVKDTQEYNDI